MLSKKKLCLLCFGYIRLNYEGDIPDEIVLLFAEWYQNGLVMIIEADLMKEFLSKSVFTH